MTATRTASGPYCGQHHQPRADCEPWDRHGHTMRFREDLWDDAERVAQAERSDVTTLLTETMEAMLGHLRCHRCSLAAEPVPVEFGDLTGKPLREWIAGAVKQVVSQHPQHEPVVIGEKVSTPATAPAAAKAVRFMEPEQASR